MTCEYQITIDFEMNDYDCEQARDTMIGMVRRVMDSFMADDQRVSIRFEKGAELS